MSGLSFAEMAEGEVDMSWIELGHTSKRSVFESLLEYKSGDESVVCLHRVAIKSGCEL